MNENNTRQTYLALRFGLVALTLMLLIAIATEMFSSDCCLYSISDYYHSPASSVFVGALCAIGVCLIAYRGNTDKENAVLDYSGFMAFIVAFVPTGPDLTGAPPHAPPPDNSLLADSVTNNVLAVLVTAIVVAIAAWRIRWLRPEDQLSGFAKRTLAVTLVLLVIGLVIFFERRDWFFQYGHTTAAILLFAGIIVVAWFNAVDFATKRNESIWWNRYTIMAFGMALTVVVCALLYAAGNRYAVLTVEVLLIVEFGVFWLVQTDELRNRPTRTPQMANAEPS
ncbi:hypothetical protein [Actinophytocola sp.]|uniref:hypothetical protein n=1 Tax=Actinophytocola sp. TaxID=1872138 RepID=UPI002ED074ED